MNKTLFFTLFTLMYKHLKNVGILILFYLKKYTTVHSSKLRYSISLFFLVGFTSVFAQITTFDTDLDGVLNGISGTEDLDDDNDGILDIIENEGINPFADTDLDGVLDYMDVDIVGFVDANTDGIDDKFDTDLDGIINQFDIDSDADGIPDNLEAQTSTGYIAASGTDVNLNGVDDNYEGGLTPIDTLITGELDYLNVNSDDDCSSDFDEVNDTDQDGESNISLTGIDSDSDGLDDSFDSIVLSATTTTTTTFTNSSGSLVAGLDVIIAGTATAAQEIASRSFTPEPYAGEDGVTSICADAIVGVNLYDAIEVTGGRTVDIRGVWTDELDVELGDYTLEILPVAIADNGGSTFTYTIVIGSCIVSSEVLVTKTNTGSDAVLDFCVTNGVPGDSIDLFDELGLASTGGSWTDPNGAVFGTNEVAFIADVAAVGVLSGGYTYTISTPECPVGSSSIVTINITTVNVPTNETNESICENETPPILSVTTGVGQTANWYNQLEDDGAPLEGGDNTLTYIPTVTEAGGYTYWVKSFDPATGCESLDFTPVMFSINGLPEVELENELICEGDDVILDSELSETGFSFQWFKDGVAITGAEMSTYSTFEAGDYYVEYTSNTLSNSITGISCEKQSTTGIVTILEEADNLVLSVGTDSFSGANSIIVEFDEDPNDNGNYELDLDSEVFQTGRVFTDVEPGFHTVTVTDLNGCGIIQEGIFVIGFPQFFSPNGDGVFDEWNVILDLDDDELVEISIFVFDRFGKLIQQVFPEGTGWDGTFAGKNMPSDDYWFTATVERIEGTETVTGNFTLIR